MNQRSATRGSAVAVLAAATMLGPAAAGLRALDLTVTSIELNQVIQTGAIPLAADRPTMVRVRIGVFDAGATPGVDGLLHVNVDNVPLPGSPFYSVNGPITAPVNPSLQNLDDTLNFMVMVPASVNVDLLVEVNPAGPNRLPESNYANNTATKDNQRFFCRATVEMIYAPIDYSGGGGGPGLPNPNLIKPGIGDGFVMGIYPTRDWNYHVAPGNPIVWTENINTSDVQLLNFLSNYRSVTIPGMGYPVAPFLYGWLPDNPYGGNGRANGIPGDVAFGNSEQTRHQRTFAHELSHLHGHSHVNRTINTVGVDVEHHLFETQGLPVIKPPTLATIMWPGLLTHEAWIDALEYSTGTSPFWSNAVYLCSSPGDSPPPGPGVLHVTGVLDNMNRTATLDPVVEWPHLSPDEEPADGELLIAAYSNALPGVPLYTVAATSLAAADSCGLFTAAGQPQRYTHSPINAMIPPAAGGRRVDRLTVADAATGVTLAQVARSPNPPRIGILSPAPGERLEANFRVTWTGADGDGDAITYYLQWSHNDGQSWCPLAVATRQTTAVADTGRIPGSKAGTGRLRLTATDGLHTRVVETGGYTLDGGNAPFTYLVTPNNGSQHLRGADIVFRANSWDLEDLMLDGASIVWTSDRDGAFGTGRLFTYNGLSVGHHRITARATDGDQQFSSATVAIDVLDRPLPGGVCGDFDGDGDVDLSDFTKFQLCFGGSNNPPAPTCPPGVNADCDSDGDVDLADFIIFQQNFTGSR